MAYSSGSVLRRADGFGTIEATSTGGNDIARIFDSTKVDAFSYKPGSTSGQMTAEMKASDSSYAVTASGFATVAAFAGTGSAADTASLTGTTGVDTLRSKPGNCRMANSGDAFKVRALAFDQVTARGGGGADLAYLRDSAGNDQLLIDGDKVKVSTSADSTWVEAVAFNKAWVYSKAGGTDSKEIKTNTVDEVLRGWA